MDTNRRFRSTDRSEGKWWGRRELMDFSSKKKKTNKKNRASITNWKCIRVPHNIRIRWFFFLYAHKMYAAPDQNFNFCTPANDRKHNTITIPRRHGNFKLYCTHPRVMVFIFCFNTINEKLANSLFIDRVLKRRKFNFCTFFFCLFLLQVN